MKNIKTYIGLDIGGSKTFSIVFRDGEILEKLKEKSPTDHWDTFLIDLIKRLKGDYEISGIGIGIPGVLDEKKEALLATPNLKNIIGINFKKILEKEFVTEIRLENDANCFAWGEYLYGEGRKFKSVAVITLGTGLGSGFVLDGKLWTGSFGTAPEMGHNIVRAGGEKCNCGNRGCWEQYASSQFILRQTGNNPKTLYEKAQDGHELALRVWKMYGYWLGLGLADISNMLEPEAIILGGGITQAWEFFEKDMLKTFKENVFSPIAQKKTKILRARLNLDAGAIGAASLFQL